MVAGTLARPAKVAGDQNWSFLIFWDLTTNMEKVPTKLWKCVKTRHRNSLKIHITKHFRSRAKEEKERKKCNI